MLDLDLPRWVLQGRCLSRVEVAGKLQVGLERGSLDLTYKAVSEPARLILRILAA